MKGGRTLGRCRDTRTEEEIILKLILVKQGVRVAMNWIELAQD
jgi:hypothetical protein